MPMLITLELLAFITAGLALTYHRAPLWLATAALAAMLAACTWVTAVPWVVAAAAWAVFLAAAAVINVRPLRRRLISDPALTRFRRHVPAMSRTERDALEAGSVWWEAELFGGRPDWRRLLSLPRPQLSAAEQAFVDGPVERLCDMLDDWRITEEYHDLPPPVWQFLKEQRLFGMIIPRRYGGLELSALAHSTVVMKIAGRSISAAVTVMVPNSLGPAELLLGYGTEQQKDYYLPRLARGDEIPCFALTGPEAGSDASAIPDRGVVCRGEFQGREVTGIRLNWCKRYITLGPVATVLGLAFKLEDPDHLLGEQRDLGITLALIPTETPGITIGNRHAPLNQAFQNGPNSGRDVFIPMDWIIGGGRNIGRGWRMLMECLAAGRSISLPALSVGGAKLVCCATGAYARVRRQFKSPIGHFEGVAEALAAMAGHTYLMDAARVMTAGAVDAGEHPAVVSALMKYNLTERMRRVVNHAMDVQGGSGICMGPRNFAARLYQAIPISITVEGANILTRSMIVFGQGAVRCHPYVLRELQAAGDPDHRRGSRAFDAALFGHIGLVLSNAVRSAVLGVTGGRIAAVPAHGAARPYMRRLTRMSAAFALVADAAMASLGGTLKRRESLSGRLADCLSQLYLASAALKRFIDDGEPAEDEPLLRWACEDALYRGQQALDGVLRNLPRRGAAAALRALVFPLGRRYAPPADGLGRQAAGVLLQPSAARSRLIRGVFISSRGDQALTRLETALEKTLAAEPIEARLHEAVHRGLLTSTDEAALIDQALAHGTVDAREAELLTAALAARRDVIEVDDFSPDYWHKGDSLWQHPAQRTRDGVATST